MFQSRKLQQFSSYLVKKGMTISQYKFSGVTCTPESGTETLEGSMILTYSELLFVYKQSQEIRIPLESITFMKGKKVSYQPNLEIQWDEGEITHRLRFIQESGHFPRNE